MADRPSPHPSDEEPSTDAGVPVHERWWWTGTFRAVLGLVVVGYQWGVISTGEAQALNWVVAAVGAAVAAWGLWLVLTAWQERQAGTARKAPDSR
jgi:hypothetical protein